VAGPTCSGKSALAINLARRFGGRIINADSMQVYRELRILTARPSPEDEAQAPHALYGVRPAADAGSVAWWRAAALEEMARTAASGCVPILCGGTGLYLSALVEGLAEIPDPGPEARAESRALLASIRAGRLHARLEAVDPATASRLDPRDSQRIARAWEVWRGTGKPLSAWLASPPAPAPWRFGTILLDPPRLGSRQAIADRFAGMLRDGAVDEVRSVLELDLDPSLPAMRAQGVPELAAYLKDEIPIKQAAANAIAATARYAKRQTTWFRHHRLAEPGALRIIRERYTALAGQPPEEVVHFVNTLLDRPEHAS